MPHATPRVTVATPKVEAAAAAARLRRYWLEELPRTRAFKASDLVDVHPEVTLRRVGAELELLGPIDFGEGDPLEGPLGEAVRGRVASLSQRAVRSVVWWHAPEPKRALRKASSNLDVFTPGDPAPAELPRLAGRLGERLPGDLAEGARGVLSGLRLVGASAHRLWFASDLPDIRAEIGRTPGAAHALHAAVAAVQGHEQPLFVCVTDPWLADNGVPIVVSGRAGTRDG